MKSFKRCQLLFISALFVSSVSAERYSVAEDSFGGVSAEAVDASKSTHPTPSKKTDTEVESAISEAPSNASSLSTNTSSIVPVEQSIEQMNDESLNNKQARTLDSKRKVNNKTQPKKIGIFEKAYLESEKAAKAKVLKSLKNKNSDNKAYGKYDATDVNAIKFVDGDELERTGGREEVEKAPYFITVDADGSLQNTFYDPVLINEALEKQRNNKLEYTQARVYEKFSQRNDAGLDLPAGADPIAAQLLNSGKKEFDLYFEAFSKLCCEKLPNIVAPSVEMGKSRAFELTNKDLYYRFSDGDSRFLLISLPADSNTNYPLRIRSFIREFKKLSINHGVFFPQIITLNAAKKPVRILSGPLLKYQAETWSTHGYLEGLFQIDRSEEKDERYVLIHTTDDVLRQSSIIETDEPIEIAHMSLGSFEVEAILEE